MVVSRNNIILLEASENAINWALETALKKFENTAEGFRQRNILTKIDNLLQGDLAKNMVNEWLTQNGIFKIEEYDKVRKDNFTNPDPDFDLIHKEKKLEIKSSNMNEGTLDFVIGNFDIKITAEDNTHKRIEPENLTSDIHIQVYFDKIEMENQLTDDKIRELLLGKGIKEQINIMKDKLGLDKRLKIAILVAWAKREDVIDFSKTLNPNTWKFEKRLYWKCPISQSRPLNELINFLKN